jgi:cell division protein FtsB
MATNIQKRREIRKLEARRDDLTMKIAKMREDLAAVRAALKQRRRT